LKAAGKKIFSAPDVVEKLGGRDALAKLEKLSFGEKVWDDKKWHETGKGQGTCVYYDEKSFADGIKMTLATEKRVLKQNRGVAGEGVWICKQKEPQYGVKGRMCRDDEVIVMTEMSDMHVEEHTCSEIIEFFSKGRTEKSGQWLSSGMGKYLAGGKAAGSMVLDQKFYERVTEGELRITLVADTVWSAEVAVKVPDASMQNNMTAGLASWHANHMGGNDWEAIELTDKKYHHAIEKFKKDFNKIAPAVGLSVSDSPLLWEVELVNSSEKGTEHGKEKWVAVDINCYCVGMKECADAISTPANPKASWNTMDKTQQEAAQTLGDTIGQKVLNIATSWFA
jgi:hypothetical protein